MSLTVRLLAPTGRDAELLVTVLRQNGIAADPIVCFADLVADGHRNPIGPLFIAEEALTPVLTDLLKQLVQTQPAWSDIPILVAMGASVRRDVPAAARELLSFGLPVYLERPLKTPTLVSSVKAALRARKRQYDNRDAILQRDAAVADLHQERAALIRSEKLAAVGRLAASISHEINNPLEAITNLLYLVHGAPELSAATRELLHMADDELQRVSQIVAHTLRFHRQATNPRPIAAAELLEPTLGIYRGRLKNSHIQVDVEHRSGQTIVCFEGDIRQVLNNLIGNAIDAMRTGGRLRIRTAMSRRWRDGADSSAALRITIADSGQGIDSRFRKHLFEPFFTTKGINGTGLGLWISWNIVEKHGGLLQVHSRSHPDKGGTVFSMLLPANPVFESSESSSESYSLAAP